MRAGRGAGAGRGRVRAEPAKHLISAALSSDAVDPSLLVVNKYIYLSLTPGLYPELSLSLSILSLSPLSLSRSLSLSRAP
jgi:hypothetical protein